MAARSSGRATSSASAPRSPVSPPTSGGCSRRCAWRSRRARPRSAGRGSAGERLGLLDAREQLVVERRPRRRLGACSRGLLLLRAGLSRRGGRGRRSGEAALRSGGRELVLEVARLGAGSSDELALRLEQSAQVLIGGDVLAQLGLELTHTLAQRLRDRLVAALGEARGLLLELRDPLLLLGDASLELPANLGDLGVLAAAAESTAP